MDDEEFAAEELILNDVEEDEPLSWEEIAPGVLRLRGTIDADAAVKLMQERRDETAAKTGLTSPNRHATIVTPSQRD